MKARSVSCCLMPEAAPANEAEIYRGLRDTLIKAHCSGQRDHHCCGRITIDRLQVTFNCPLCGDVRQMIPNP